MEIEERSEVQSVSRPEQITVERSMQLDGGYPSPETIAFDTNWEYKNRHWDAPTSITVHHDGTMIFKVRHLANMYRHPGPVDDGPNFYFLLRFKNTGPNPFEVGLSVAKLGYRQVIDNATIRLNYPGWGVKLHQAFRNYNPKEMDVWRDAVQDTSGGKIIVPIITDSFGGMVDGTIRTLNEAPIWVRNG